MSKSVIIFFINSKCFILFEKFLTTFIQVFMLFYIFRSVMFFMSYFEFISWKHWFHACKSCKLQSILSYYSKLSSIFEEIGYFASKLKIEMRSPKSNRSAVRHFCVKLIGWQHGPKFDCWNSNFCKRCQLIILGK